MKQAHWTRWYQHAPRLDPWLLGVAFLFLWAVLSILPQSVYAEVERTPLPDSDRKAVATPAANEPIRFVVNSASDDVDANIGDGVCATPQGVCTLRAAIQEANASFDEAFIELPAGIYRLSIPGRDEDNSVSGDLDITSPLSLHGSGSASTIIEGGGIDRVLDIGEDAHPGTAVLLANLTIRGGNDHGDNAPGGIRIRSYKVTLEDVIVADNRGEGIGIDKGALILKNSLVKDNQSLGVGGIRATSSSLLIFESVITGNRGAWGGIASDTWLNMLHSTVSDNKGSAGPGGLRLSGSATITNSTISSNDGSEGAAIWMNNGNLIILNSTITANRAVGSGGNWRSGAAGGIFFKEDKGSVILTHTILAENTSSAEKPNCSGTILSKGYNLIGRTDGCHFISTETDLINAQPLLAPLQDNGGPTYTHALLPNSPAIDAGSPQGCAYRDQTPLFRDQRNHRRPSDGDGDGTARCDIGAFEYDGMAPTGATPKATATTELLPYATQLPDEAAFPTPTKTASSKCKELVMNGGFETEEGWYFPKTVAQAAYDQSLAHRGRRSARTGILSPLNNTLSYSSVWQQVAIPPSIERATLSFWIYPVNTGPIEDYHGGDLQLALLLDYPYWSMGASPVREKLLSLRSNSRTWTYYEFDLTSYAGRTLWLYFGTYNNGWAGSWGSPMAMYVDDVSLVVCPATD